MAHMLLDDRYFRLDPEIEDWDLDDTRHLQVLKVLADRDFTRNSEEIKRRMRMPFPVYGNRIQKQCGSPTE